MCRSMLLLPGAGPRLLVMRAYRPCRLASHESLPMNNPTLFRTVLILAAALVAFSGVMDDASQTIAQDSFKRALVTFAAARTLNGVISAAQGTEIALEPGGVGVILSIGEALDPINDLIERFSTVMLIATSSLGVQNILLGISRWWGINVALAVIGLAVLLTAWSRIDARDRIAIIASRMFAMILFVRFAVPLLVIGTSLISQAFLDEGLDESTAALESTRSEIEELSEAPAGVSDEDRSLLDRLGSAIDESIQSMNASRRLDELRETASNAAEHIVNLIVIFVLQTILLPLGIFWLLLEIVKSFVARMAQRPA